MKSTALKRVDLIFEKCDVKEILTSSLKKKPEEIVQMVLDSGLRGRGGAGFPTGMKWRFTAAEKGSVKYIVCNADEGESGTFKDRQILDEVPRKKFRETIIGFEGVPTGGSMKLLHSSRSMHNVVQNYLDFPLLKSHAASVHPAA